MSLYANFDLNLFHHPKMVDARAEVGSVAFALYVEAVCYARRHLTDGFIRRGVAKTLLPDAGERVIQALVDCGLWDSAEGGYQIHDYTEWNPTRADVESKRAAWNERQRKSRERRAAAIPSDHMSQRDNRVSHGGVTDTDPDPDTNPEAEASSAGVRACVPASVPASACAGARAHEGHDEARPPHSKPTELASVPTPPAPATVPPPPPTSRSAEPAPVAATPRAPEAAPASPSRQTPPSAPIEALSPEADAILTALRAHPELAPVALLAVAERLSGKLMTGAQVDDMRRAFAALARRIVQDRSVTPHAWQQMEINRALDGWIDTEVKKRRSGGGKPSSHKPAEQPAPRPSLHLYEPKKEEPRRALHPAVAKYHEEWVKKHRQGKAEAPGAVVAA